MKKVLHESPPHLTYGFQMDQNPEAVDTLVTSMSQDQAQNIESTRLSQTTKNQANPIVPHVGAYAAQCSLCFKLRSIPSKKKFEKICANKKRSFVCASVCKWRPEVSCNNDADLPEDGSLKFAIEKPNIARLPRGWKRLVKIRRDSEGARFADVYYFSPSGQRLRSNTDVERYLRKHPDETKRVRLSQFSFQPPKPAYRLKRSSDV